MLSFLNPLRTLTAENAAWVALIRMAVAALLGGIIGIERGRKRRPAGFRTYMFVCLGAALAMTVSQYLVMMANEYWQYLPIWSEKNIDLKKFTDVSRFGAQVINGIGFLGAGTVIVTGHQEVKGLTTAAGLWACACMGLCVGAGYVEGAVIGGTLILFTIVVFSRLEKVIVNHARNITLYIQFANVDDVGKIITAIKNEEVRILDVDIHKHNEEGMYQSAVFSVRLPNHKNHAALMAMLAGIENVHSISEL